MARLRYNSLANARAAFEDLRLFRKALIDMKRQYRPFGPDYLMFDVILKALDTAAYHFTPEPDFFTIKLEQSNGGAPSLTEETLP